MDRLINSPCTALRVLAAKWCCSRTTQWRNSSTGPLVRTTRRCFHLVSERAKCLCAHPPVRHFAYIAMKSVHFTIVIFFLISDETKSNVRVRTARRWRTLESSYCKTQYSNTPSLCYHISGCEPCSFCADSESVPERLYERKSGFSVVR